MLIKKLLILPILISLIIPYTLCLGKTPYNKDIMKHSPNIEVKIYTKPTCPYCIRAKDLLDSKNIDYQEFNVAEDSNAGDFDLVKDYLYQNNLAITVPQIYIKGVYIGGYNALIELEESGKLDDLLIITN